MTTDEKYEKLIEALENMKPPEELSETEKQRRRKAQQYFSWFQRGVMRGDGREG